ncbi:hypothetical protein [Catenulispora rubra]|uniref:hypothetical protein n=1 Tax=Catenulispora rubra TaxID=280293 RepID=UPI0018920C11|nr:hypothetical protein [Catenulispora rubra]
MSAAHRSARRAAVPLAALLTAAAFGIATPAHATSLYASADCSSSGGGHFVCVATVTGGTAPYAYSWTPIYNAAIRGGANGQVVIGVCDVNRQGSLDLTVTDSTGATWDTTGGLDCSGEAP